MPIRWRAVLAGIVTTFIVGLLGGATVPFTSVTLPVLGAALSGVVGGFVAGYVSGSDTGSGALNGGLATALGAIVATVVLTLAGLFLSPFASLGILALGLLFVFGAAIPGFFGGIVGAWAKGRRHERAAEEPAPP